MTQTPFAIDEVNLAEILGEQKIIELSTEFYNRVYEDKDEWFLSMFPKGEEGKKMAIQNQSEFFIERFGGRPLFSKRKGHPALRARHARFPIDKKAAERWLFHMKEALDAITISGDSFSRIWPFFEHVANFLINQEEEEESSQKSEEEKEEEKVHLQPSSNVTKAQKVAFLLRQKLSANIVEVEDQSGGCGTKLSAVIVSSIFEGKTPIARHQLVHETLKDEMKDIHALSLKTWTPQQWEKRKSEA